MVGISPSLLMVVPCCPQLVDASWLDNRIHEPFLSIFHHYRNNIDLPWTHVVTMVKPTAIATAPCDHATDLGRSAWRSPCPFAAALQRGLLHEALAHSHPAAVRSQLRGRSMGEASKTIDHFYQCWWVIHVVNYYWLVVHLLPIVHHGVVDSQWAFTNVGD